MEAPVDRKQEDKACKIIHSVTWVDGEDSNFWMFEWDSKYFLLLEKTDFGWSHFYEFGRPCIKAFKGKYTF